MVGLEINTPVQWFEISTEQEKTGNPHMSMMACLISPLSNNGIRNGFGSEARQGIIQQQLTSETFGYGALSTYDYRHGLSRRITLLLVLVKNRMATLLQDFRFIIITAQSSIDTRLCCHF